VVLPDGSYGKVTKAELLSGIAGGTTPTLQEVTDEGANTTNLVSVYNTDDDSTTSLTSLGVDFINPSGLTGVSLKAATQTGNVGEVLIPDAGTTTKTIAFQEYVDAEISSAVVGLLDDRGNHDASSNTFPSSGGSGTAGAILKGDLWTISVGGTLGGVAVTVGDVIRAKVDAPGTTSSNWVITGNNIGYVPENSVNKATTMTGNTTSDTNFLTAKAVYDWVTSLGYWVSVNATNLVAGISKLYNAIGTETDGGITPNAVKDALDLKANKTDIEPLIKRRYFDDLQGLGPGGINGIFQTSSSFVLEGNINIMKLGSGAVWTRVASELGHSGVIRGGTGSAATNGNYIQFRSIWMGTEDFIIESSTRLQQLSSASQRFINSLSYGVPNNIIQLSYADNVNGGKWFCECTNASITSSVDSGVNVAINTWYNLKIVRISMVCYFYVNNVLVGTISTNVPSGIDAVCQQQLTKLIGTTSVTADFDYLKMFDL
jgi:hypothetical protein